MEKFIPYEKLSKKEKRKMDLAKRQTWGELNPVTRKPENSKAYNRRKAQNWRKDLPNSVPYLFSADVPGGGAFGTLCVIFSHGGDQTGKGCYTIGDT